MTQMNLLDLLVDDDTRPTPAPTTYPTRSVEPIESRLRQEMNPRGYVPWRWLLPGGDLKIVWRIPSQPLDPPAVRLDACPQEKLCRTAGWTRMMEQPPAAWSCGYCGLQPPDGYTVGEDREPTQSEITVNAVAIWLGPHGLNRVIQALGTKHIDAVRRRLADEHDRSCGGPGYRLHGSATGIQVEQWFAADPFRITWNQVFAVVRARTTPELAEALAAVCDGHAGGCTPDQWAAADAILHRRAS